ncbi:MAG: hypothetical protein LVQ95_00735 [Candidatus Micrarchaeales archaeon]|nr:hypothetical protein [Candidatus Micrarchaeales archaeon]
MNNNAYIIVAVGLGIILIFAALDTLPGTCYTEQGGGNPCIARSSPVAFTCRPMFPNPINYTNGSVTVSMYLSWQQINFTPGVGTTISNTITNISIVFVNSTDTNAVTNTTFSSPGAENINLVSGISQYNVTLRHVLQQNSCQNVTGELWSRYTYTNGQTVIAEMATLDLFSGRQTYLNEWFGPVPL